MKRVYLAAPLFDDMELQRNVQICGLLEGLGFKVYLPQRDSGEAAKGADREDLFRMDITGIEESDCIVALLDGRVPDEGTCFEMGYAHALKKPVYALLTDRRSFIQGHLNVMLEQCVQQIFTSTENLFMFFKYVFKEEQDMISLNEVQKSIGEQLTNSDWFNFPTTGEAENKIDLAHAVTGLNEEAGEVAGLLKKQVFRGKERTAEQWMGELGDVLWYLTATATIKGITLEEIWEYNCNKLAARREAGTKGGESWEG